MPHRTEPFPLAKLPGSLPRAQISDNADHAAITAASLNQLDSLSIDVLTPEAIWRDILALTGTFRTFFGSRQVASIWKRLSTLHRPSKFSLVPKSSRIIRLGPDVCWIQAMYSFETEGHPEGHPGLNCSGFIGIVPDPNKYWKIWLLTSMVEQIRGFSNVDVMEPRLGENMENGVNRHTEVPDVPHGITDGVNGDVKSQTSFQCVVVGAGMAGLSAVGRLQALGVSAVALERNAQIGDNWTKRYDSVALHTSKEYGHLPFSRTFPLEDPYFLTGQDLARGFQRYVDHYDINVWLSTNLESA